MKNSLRSWLTRSGALFGPYCLAHRLGRISVSSLSSILLTLGSLVAVTQTAHAQFPINESFTNATTSTFTLGGSATLTGTTGTPGYLQLTPKTAFQAGYAILNGSFGSQQGFSISFEFFSYGGTGADGFSVFMIDAAGTDPTTAGQFQIGGAGGSLGYAQFTNVNPTQSGVTKGYIGIGIDEFGNFSNPTEGRNGGPGLTPGAVAIRGAGTGTGTTDYPYLTGTGSLPFKLDVKTVRAQPGDADYRKAYIYVVPSNGAYKVTVRIQHGTAITTTTDSYTVPTPPANLRIGFSGSTGGSTNIHEIRNLAIVTNPYAADDLAGTTYKTSAPVSFNVLANDQGVGAAIDPGTVDLDPSTAGIQSTFTVAGKGTFVVDDKGVVTFTPSGTFAGTFTISYVVSDLLKQVSNAATITMIVEGADVATGVSGPTAANPGSQVTYTVSNTNIGSQTATNLTPTLQLPTNLTIPTSANYTYSSTTGLVTFNAITLAQNGAVSNSITFNIPASGATSVTATADYTYPAGAIVPDPTPGNNTASVTTIISGSTTIATDCATPGSDGPAVLTSTSTPNTYYPGVSVSATNNTSTITVGTPSGSTTPVAAGDLVLVMQMQGAVIDNSATSSNYGTVSTSTAGQYEYAAVASVGSTTITLNKALANTYTNGTDQNFQVIRVPQYSSLSVTSTVTGAAWNSLTKVGGVLALDVAGSTAFTNGTGLNMTAKGFSGGGGQGYTGSTTPNASPTVYATLSTAGAHGAKGESVAGTPRYFYNGSSVTDTNVDYPDGTNNIGAPANGGGGAQDFAPASNTGNSGGGGGANGVAGGVGGFGFSSNSTGNQAIGGKAFVTSAKVLIMGGGGGAGSAHDATNGIESSGGIGGGIVILRTGTVSGTATIQADGYVAPSTAGNALTQGGGGGGAGGSILVLTTPATGASDLTTLTASAVGGNGGSVNNVAGGASYGPGGGGGGGVVLSNSALSAAAAVAGGASGVTNISANGSTSGAFGAAAGTAGLPNPTTSAASTNTMGGASSCLPVLSVALSTATPNVTRTANSTPTPAMYTALISNTGGTAQNTATTITLDPLFTYDDTYAPVVTSTTASGTSTTLSSAAYTVTGTTAPVFSITTIPSGSTLDITFQTKIASTAVNNTVYQASAAVAFTDPTRTAAAPTATPGNTFSSGGGTVPGTNYAAVSSTLEDVTIVAPLPVELIRFEVTAVRQNAVLAWTTASEKNNDHFVVERSLTGSSFSAIGTARGQGNSSHTTNYGFTDSGAGRLASETVYYRLQQVDADGATSYSPVRTVRFTAVAKATATLYPNPSQDKTTIDLTGLAAGTYSVQVLDLAGRVLRTQQLGAQTSLLELQGLPQGAYIVLVRGVGINQALPLIRN